MEVSNSQNSANNRLRKFLSFVFHSRLAVSGLVFVTILFAVLFYAHAGFFTPLETQPGSFAQNRDSNSTETEVPEVAQQTPLDKEEPANPPAAESAPDGTQPKNTRAAISTCSAEYKERVEQAYTEALSSEKQRHEKYLSRISKISRLIAKLNQSQDPVTEEKRRHEAAIKIIESNYKKTLESLGC